MVTEEKREFSDSVIDVFKTDGNNDVKTLLKEELGVTDSDLEEYPEVLNGDVKEALDKLKNNHIDLKSLSLITLTDVDNFISNVNLLTPVSNEDLVKYSAKLTLLPNSKVVKYLNDYKVVYRYPQGNLYLGVFDLNENIVQENSKGLVKVDSNFFYQYPQFQASNCDMIANVIHTCKVNNIEYQDEDKNYYMFVFDTKEFNNMYPDVNIVAYKG